MEQNDKFINETSVSFAQEFIVEAEKVNFIYDDIHQLMNSMLENKNLKYKDVMPFFRIALFGSSNGPDVVKSMIILGKEESFNRVNTLLKTYEG